MNEVAVLTFFSVLTAALAEKMELALDTPVWMTQAPHRHDVMLWQAKSPYSV